MKKLPYWLIGGTILGIIGLISAFFNIKCSHDFMNFGCITPFEQLSLKFLYIFPFINTFGIGRNRIFLFFGNIIPAFLIGAVIGFLYEKTKLSLRWFRWLILIIAILVILYFSFRPI